MKGDLKIIENYRPNTKTTDKNLKNFVGNDVKEIRIQNQKVLFYL
jgi:hypothetical protein